MAVDRDEGDVRNARKLLDRGEARNAVHLGAGRVHRPDLSRVTELAALLDDTQGWSATDDRDGAWNKGA